MHRAETRDNGDDFGYFIERIDELAHHSITIRLFRTPEINVVNAPLTELRNMTIKDVRQVKPRNFAGMRKSYFLPRHSFQLCTHHPSALQIGSNGNRHLHVYIKSARTLLCNTCIHVYIINGNLCLGLKKHFAMQPGHPPLVLVF